MGGWPRCMRERSCLKRNTSWLIGPVSVLQLIKALTVHMRSNSHYYGWQVITSSLNHLIFHTFQIVLNSIKKGPWQKNEWTVALCQHIIVLNAKCQTVFSYAIQGCSPARFTYSPTILTLFRLIWKLKFMNCLHFFFRFFANITVTALVLMFYTR